VRHPRRILVLVLALALLSGSTARARGIDAQTLLRRAVTDYNHGRYSSALFALAEARAEATEPKLLGRIHLFLGLCFVETGHRAQAIEAFQVALQNDPQIGLEGPRAPPRARQLLEEVRRGGELAITSEPSDATVFLDGQNVGRTPFVRALPLGPHRVRIVSVDGLKQLEARVVLTIGWTRYHARLEPIPGLLASAAAPVAPPRSRVFTWIAGGISLASLAVAVGFGAVAERDYEEFQKTESAKRYDDLKGSIPRDSTVANVMFGVAGAFAVTAVVLFFVEGRRPGAFPRTRPAASAEVSSAARPFLRPRPGGDGLSALWRF
jgi:hypothetical protein